MTAVWRLTTAWLAPAMATAGGKQQRSVGGRDAQHSVRPNKQCRRQALPGGGDAPNHRPLDGLAAAWRATRCVLHCDGPQYQERKTVKTIII